MFPPSSFEAGPSEVSACLALAGTARGSAVLDLACGPGRHTVPLARAGYQIVGVDYSEAYLAELRHRLDDEATRRGRPFAVELVHCDMREFSRHRSFDLALSLYHSLGYFRDDADNQRVFAVLHDSLRVGGAAVVQLVAKESLKDGFQPHLSVDLDDGTRLIQQRAPSDDWSWMEVSWTFVREGGERRFDLSHRIYSAPELRDQLSAAGFSAVDLYGGFDGRAYDRAAQKLVAVAHRTL
jgi:SAM-dependent methyltransferase